VRELKSSPRKWRYFNKYKCNQKPSFWGLSWWCCNRPPPSQLFGVHSSRTGIAVIRRGWHPAKRVWKLVPSLPHSF